MAITKVRASSIDLTTDTTQLSMAKGTTAQRPTGASSLSAEYLIVAGGGAGGGFGGGGGGVWGVFVLVCFVFLCFFCVFFVCSYFGL